MSCQKFYCDSCGQGSNDLIQIQKENSFATLHYCNDPKCKNDIYKHVKHVYTILNIPQPDFNENKITNHSIYPYQENLKPETILYQSVFRECLVKALTRFPELNTWFQDSNKVSIVGMVVLWEEPTLKSLEDWYFERVNSMINSN